MCITSTIIIFNILRPADLEKSEKFERKSYYEQKNTNRTIYTRLFTESIILSSGMKVIFGGIVAIVD